MAWVVQAHVGCPLAGLPIRRDGRNPGQPAQSWNGCRIVDIDVIPMRSDKPRKGGSRAAPGGCGGQNQPAHHGNQDDQDQPGAPPAAKLGAEHQPDCAHDDLLTPVLFTEPGASKVVSPRFSGSGSTNPSGRDCNRYRCGKLSDEEWRRGRWAIVERLNQETIEGELVTQQVEVGLIARRCRHRTRWVSPWQGSLSRVAPGMPWRRGSNRGTSRPPERFNRSDLLRS